MEIVILGAGGHGHDIATVAEAAGHTVVAFYDDNKLGYKPCELHRMQLNLEPYLIGVNSPDQRCELNRIAGISPSVVHPAAHVGPRCTLDPGTVIAAGAILSNDVQLGQHTHIGAGSTLVRCQVGRYVTIAPGVHVGGDVTISEGAFVGIGARIKNLVNIGAWATIGAGAVVVDDVPPGVTVTGCPARPLERAA